jgi:hypothetical protein
MNQYTGSNSGGTPGLFPSPYFFWSDGAIWDGMIDYWFLTGDTSYNNAVGNALQFQVGDSKDYMPTNQTKEEVCVSNLSQSHMFPSITLASHTLLFSLVAYSRCFSSTNLLNPIST